MNDAAAISTSDGAHVARDFVNFVWLVRLRWSAIAAQAAAIGLARYGLGLELRTDLLAAIVVAEAVSNGLVWFGLRRRPWGDAESETTLACILALDLLFFTALLACSGGESNPFSVLYLVNISLAAAVLRGRWAWALTGLAVACFASLFVCHVPVPALAHGGAAHVHPPSSVGGVADSMNLHLRGMLIAFAVAAGFIAYFVGRTRRELDRRDAELAREQSRRAQAEKIESLATLAAGAAHELATPLATIAVVAHELESRLTVAAADPELVEDARTIERETRRCRRVLGSLAGQAGERRGESWRTMRLDELLSAARRTLSRPDLIEVGLNPEDAAIELRTPAAAIVSTLQSLLQNAVDATEGERPIRVRANRGASTVQIEIVDRGCGMSSALLGRLGEPFFTTKPTGLGMGLGVFVARRVVRQLGGAVEYQSQVGEGTTVRVTLPADWNGA